MTLHRRVGARRGERGASLLGLLAALLVLGVMAAIAVSTLGGATHPPSSATSPQAPAGGGTPNSDISAALSARCVADYTALSSALQVYTSLHGSNPPAGTTWLTNLGGSSAGVSWPGDPGHFRFTWNGRVIGVIPEHGPSSGGSPGQVATSGCYARLS